MTIRDQAEGIGDAMVKVWPPNRPMFIPHQSVEEIADKITEVVAVILQSYLDAGSERDVTFEELGPPILEHVKGWSDGPENAPAT